MASSFLKVEIDMNDSCFETHRCKELLKSECSIRKYAKNTNNKRGFLYKDEKWHLFSRVYDLDYDTIYMEEVATIIYCPWCGDKLPSY